jgi:hypothetical protein
MDGVPYFDAVRDLAMKLSRSLPIPEWTTGIPATYSPREIESIELFRLAVMKATPDALRADLREPLEKLISEIGLLRLGRRIQNPSMKNYNLDAAKDWAGLTSIHLKAWLNNSSPFVLLDIATLLSNAGKVDDARKTLSAASVFPAYALTRKLSDTEMMALAIVRDEYPPGPHRSAHEEKQGIYSPESIALLEQEIAHRQAILDGRGLPEDEKASHSIAPQHSSTFGG